MLFRENPKNGDKLSQLGFGCMRFPRRGTSIDITRSTNMIHSSIEKGVNYFDTAYIYPGSEVAVGKALAGEWRKKVNIATKLPLIMVKSSDDFDKFFLKQLERLQTDYIDYYLMHMLTDFEHFKKFQDMGIENWIEKQKKSGRIRNIGFSFHGRQESFTKIIDAYDWEFCMIQYNYIDEYHQAGVAGLKYAHSKGLPVISMEPLRGGKLVNGLPAQALKAFSEVNPNRTPVDWGLRWIWNQPEVTLLLSGMSNEEQVNQNIEIASNAKIGALSQKELDAYKKVTAIMRKAIKINCTGCGYCLPCPAGVDIPGCFGQYNDTPIKKLNSVRVNYMAMHGVIPKKPSYASLCKRCGKCETHCPQDIKIMDMLNVIAKELEPFWLKPTVKIARTFMGSNKNSNK